MGMGIELGSVLSGIGNAAGSLGRACTGIAERGGAAPPPSMAGGIFRPGLDFRGPQLSILSAPVIKEGPVSLSDLKSSAKVQTSVINPLGEIRFYPKPEPQIPEAPSEPLAAPHVEQISFQEHVSQVQPEAVLPISLDPLVNQESAVSEAARIMQVRRLIEIQPKVSPSVLPDLFPEPSPVPFTAASPASGPKTEKKVYSKPALAVSAQPALAEEEVLEEVVAQRPASKQIDIVEEAPENMFLKEVVDEQVLDKRIYEFGEAIEKADFDAEVISAEGEEIVIDGSRVAELAGPETKDNRSGLVKDDGPDGSRVEVIEEAKGKKYKSKKQAKDEIFAAIFQKPPVKRAIEGKEAGREAVMRVLKFLLVRYLAPAKQEAVKIFKKRTIQKTGLPVKPVEVGFLQQEREEQAEGNTIGTLNLKDIFPKAA